MIQAVIHRLLESIRGLDKSRLDWGLYFEFMERHQHRPRQQLPLILQCGVTNCDAPFQIFIWWQTWKSRDGALYVVSWSCRRAGAVASRTTAKQNILQLYNPGEPGPRTRLLPLPRWFYAAWHSLAALSSTRQLLEGFFFFLKLILRSFSLKDDTSSYSVEIKICRYSITSRGYFQGVCPACLEGKLLHTFISDTSVFKLLLVCFVWGCFS